MRDQNSPWSPCRANSASASAAPARSQSGLSRVAYQSRPSAKTVWGKATAPRWNPRAGSHSRSSPSDRKAAMFAQVKPMSSQNRRAGTRKWIRPAPCTFPATML